MRRIRTISAIVFSALLAVIAGTAVAADTPRLDARIDVSVVVEGSLPGFTADQLSAYVTEQMNGVHAAAWSFIPASTASAPNRVIWRFRLLPYAGGSVRRIGPLISRAEEMFGVRRAIGIDARVFIGGKFESTTFDQATIKGGARDPDLAEAVRRVARSVVANVVAERPLLRTEDTSSNDRAALLTGSKAAGSKTNGRS